MKVVQFDDHEPHVELAILAKSDHYIGNCISTFSAFAARERLMAHKTNSFWAVDNLLSESKPKKKRKIVGHVADEL